MLSLMCWNVNHQAVCNSKKRKSFKQLTNIRKITLETIKTPQSFENYRLRIMYHAKNCELHFGMATNVEYYHLLSLIGLSKMCPVVFAIIDVCFRQCHVVVTAQQAVTSPPFWVWDLLIPVWIQMTVLHWVWRYQYCLLKVECFYYLWT